jgi:hypothetical protein
MKGQGLNDLPRCELERRSSHHKGIFFEVPKNSSEIHKDAVGRPFAQKNFDRGWQGRGIRNYLIKIVPDVTTVGYRVV